MIKEYYVNYSLLEANDVAGKHQVDGGHLFNNMV